MKQLPLLPLVLDGVPPGLVQALVQEGVPVRERDENHLAGRFVLFDSRCGPCESVVDGQVPIDIDSLREDFNRDPFDALLNGHSARHKWNILGLTVAEEVASTDRRIIKRRMLRRLRQKIQNAGGIWLCLSAYPFPYRSALNFRIDYDQYDNEDFTKTLDAIAGNEHATSHFVNAAAYLPHRTALARLQGLDIGSHGFWHHTYRTKEENLVNIRRGISSLQACGLDPSGFVAPGGRFNRGLLLAMGAMEISHSSEFGLAYDDVPFSPQGSKVLQVPIHPICLGTFLETVQGENGRRAAATRQAVRAAVEYFRQTTQAKYAAGEPVFLYGHPTARLGRHPEVLGAVFETAENFGAVWKTTLSRFARWWRLRSRVRIKVVERDGQFIVRAVHQPKTCQPAIEYWRGRHVARMPLTGREIRFTPSALAYESRTPNPGIRAVREQRPKRLREQVLRMIDWEKETPVEEIPASDLRNLAKRTLRKWRA